MRSKKILSLNFFKIFAFLSLVMILFIILPIISMVLNQLFDIDELLKAIKDEAVWRSILLTCYAALLSTIIALIFGTPLAYLLARSEFYGKSIIEGFVDLPVIVPHTVAGIALLAVFGSKGLIGSFSPIKFVDALPGIVVAMLFVSAPFYINTVREGFQSIDLRLEQVARTLGASQLRVFITITIPLIWRHVAAGSLMSWARAISEFGAVVIIAYYPMIAPTLIYDRFLTSGLSTSRPVAVILILFCFVVFIFLRILLWERKNESS
ncbi:MAG TPA: ABC transporter permease subunit [Archaeoglobaceae archaeon]|nr:ABC transporter permease subunit [Archaeoglobaceae archaeon]